MIRCCRAGYCRPITWGNRRGGGGWKCSGTSVGNCARSNPNSPVQTFVAYATKVRHGNDRQSLGANSLKQCQEFSFLLFGNSPVSSDSFNRFRNLGCRPIYNHASVLQPVGEEFNFGVCDFSIRNQSSAQSNEFLDAPCAWWWRVLAFCRQRWWCLCTTLKPFTFFRRNPIRQALLPHPTRNRSNLLKDFHRSEWTMRVILCINKIPTVNYLLM